jgi:hypothetical protein
MPHLAGETASDTLVDSQLIRFTSPDHCSALEGGESIKVAWTSASHWGTPLPPVSLYLALPGCPHSETPWTPIGSVPSSLCSLR